MRRIIPGVAICLAIIAAGCSSSSTSGSGSGPTGGGAPKLAGKWEITSGAGSELGKVIEFGADGKVIGHENVDGKLMTEAIGAYTTDGDKITVKKGGEPQGDVLTIKSLTDTELTLVDGGGKDQHFKRVK